MALDSNVGEFLARLRSALEKASTATGHVAVELVTDQMLIGYDRPIWKTGDLVRSITAHVSEENGEIVIDVGSNMEYAPYVHEGTYKTPGRPFLRDALLSSLGQQALKEVFEEQIASAFR